MKTIIPTRKLYFLILYSILLIPYAKAQQRIEISDTPIVYLDTTLSPLGNTRSLSQYFIPVETLRSAGAERGFIQKLFLSGNAFRPLFFPDIQIYIRAYSGAAPDTFMDNQWMYPFIHTSFSVTDTGWQSMQAFQPFYWDGEQGLLLQFCVEGDTGLSESWLRGYDSGGSTSLRAELQEYETCDSRPFPVPIHYMPIMAFEIIPDPPGCSPLSYMPVYGTSGLPTEGIRLAWHTPVNGGNPEGYRIFLDTISPPLQVLTWIQGNDSFYITGELLPQKGYFWKVQPENSGGSAQDCPVQYFETGPQYCTTSPYFSGGIKFATLDFPDHIFDSNHDCSTYRLHTDTLVLHRGDTMDLVIQSFSCSALRDFYIGLALDVNGDGGFDTPGEILWSGGPFHSTSLSAGFRIPQDSLSGYTRMRCIIQEGHAVSDFCGAYSFGKTEDIILRLAQAQPPLCLAERMSNLSGQVNICPDAPEIFLTESQGLVESYILLAGTQIDLNAADTFLLTPTETGYRVQGVLTPAQTYYYSILPVGPGGSPQACPVDSFTTDIHFCSDTICPGSPVFPPEGDTFVYPAGINLTWSGDTGLQATELKILADTVHPPLQSISPWLSGDTRSFLFKRPEANTNYYWQIKWKDRNGIIRDCPGSYVYHTALPTCVPEYQQGTSGGDYISKVRIGTMNRQSEGIQSFPYYERWDSVIPELTAGTVCSLYLSPGTYPSGNRFAAWIDYNRNGIWDDAEKTGEIEVDAPFPAEGVISFIVPGCTDTGYTLLRIREVWGVEHIHPCDTYPFGETEEYLIKITPPLALPPVCPVPISPLTGADSLPVNGNIMRWKIPVFGSCAEQLKFYLGTNYPPGNIFSSHQLAVQDSFILPDLLPGTQYYWKVESENTQGLSVACPVQSFTTCLTPQPPHWLSPEGIGCDRFTLRWANLQTTNPYQLQIALDSQFQQLAHTGLIFVPGFSDRYSRGGLAQGQEYYCRIRGIGICDTGMWSAGISLSTLSVPSAPVWLDNNASACHEIHLKWSTVGGANAYQLDVSGDSLFQHFLTGYQQRNMGNQNQIWVPGLRASRPYYSRVTAVNACGTSTYSPVFSASTDREEWLGIQASWHAPQNWCSGYVPDTLTDIRIPAQRMYMPEITQSAYCRSLQLDTGAHLYHNTSDTFCIYGNWVHHGRYHRGNGTLNFKGNSPQWISGTDTLNHLIVNNIQGVHLDSQSLWVLRGFYTPVMGTLYTSGRLQVYCDSLQQGGISREISPLGRTEGVVQYRQIYSKTAGPRLIGTPFYNTSIGDWWAGQYGTPRLCLYYEPAFGHRSIGFIENWNAHDTLGAGVGYWAEIPADNDILLSGNLTEGTVVVPVSFTVDPNNRSASGWNLGSNPYLCPINWDASEGFVKTNISTTLNFLDPETGLQAVYNNGIGTMGATSIIPPGQAFWLKAFANDPVFIMDERIKVQASGKLFRTSIDLPLMRIGLSQNGQVKCEAVVCLRPGTDESYEPEYDALYPDIFETLLPDRTQIWIESPTQERYTIYNNEKIGDCKICIKAPHAGTYRLDARTEGNLEKKIALEEVSDLNPDENQLKASGDIYIYKPGIYCPWKITVHQDNAPNHSDSFVKVFPNPLHAEQKVCLQKEIDSGETIEYRVFNSLGISVCQGQFSESRFYISSDVFSTPGMYILELKIGGKRQVHTLVYLP